MTAMQGRAGKRREAWRTCRARRDSRRCRGSSARAGAAQRRLRSGHVQMRRGANKGAKAVMGKAARPEPRMNACPPLPRMAAPVREGCGSPGRPAPDRPYNVHMDRVLNRRTDPCLPVIAPCAMIRVFCQRVPASGQLPAGSCRSSRALGLGRTRGGIRHK